MPETESPEQDQPVEATVEPLPQKDVVTEPIAPALVPSPMAGKVVLQEGEKLIETIIED